MQLRKLGRTGIEVSEIGLGTEYLHGPSRQTVSSVIKQAVDVGVNYLDILWCYPEYLSNLGAALDRLRDRATLAVHLGPALTDGQYRRSRDARECEANFDDMLSRLRTDRADIAMIQWMDTEEDFDGVTRPDGLLDLAHRIKDGGRARFIGVSAHAAPIALKAVKSGLFDVLMFPINPAFDSLPGEADIESLDVTAEAAPATDRRAVYEICAAEGVGLVAMKPFAGGRFFQARQSQVSPWTPVQLLSYALSQVGVSTAVPGVKSVRELRAVLRFLEASDAERDFSLPLAESTWSAKGACVYCNHCLPCPSGIDVGHTLRLLAIGEQGVSAELRADYDSLPAHASDCTECGQCMERCPFDVDVIEHLRRAAEIFGG